MQVFACNLMRKHLLAKYFTINFQQYFLLPHYRTNPTIALTVLRLGSVKFCLFLYVCCIKMAIFFTSIPDWYKITLFLAFYTDHV